MAKFTLEPRDISNLLKNHPEVELELINKAVEQVADGMSRKVTKELVEKRVGELMESLLTEQVGWNQRRLAPKLQAMIESGVKTACEQILSDTEGMRVMALVRSEAQRQMEATARDLAKTMRNEIRTVIREEIRSMLMGGEQR